MSEILKRFQKSMAAVLSATMALVLVLAFIDLAWTVAVDILSPPLMLLDINELLDIFGLFLLVLIGIELLETVARTYLTDDPIHIETVLLVALIAVSRKVIIMDLTDYPPMTLAGMAAIILALAAGYHLLKSRGAAWK